MGYIYEWLSSLFGTQLSDFLWGYNCDTQAYDGPQVYVGIGIVTFIIVLFSIILFYLIIDRPKWSNKWLPWLLCGLITCLVAFLIGSIWTLTLYWRGAIGDCLEIYPYQCWMFGLANAIDTAILYLLLSFIFKRFISLNNPHTPWRSRFWVVRK